MEKERKIAKVVRKVSFAEAEKIDIAYYASLSWKESVRHVEEMRKHIWQNKQGEYPKKIEPVFFKSKKWEDIDG